MNIVMIAFGTRGDVQPAIALGKALHARGYGVRILAGSNFTPWIERHGLEAIGSSVDIEAMMQSADGKRWVAHGTEPIMQTRMMRTLLNQVGWDSMCDAWAACQDADVIISTFTSDLYCASIAEKLGVPRISILLQPSLVATRNGAAMPSAPLPNRISLINYVAGKILLETFLWTVSGKQVNRFRQKVLDLPPQTYHQARTELRRALVVHGYSRHVVPHPADWPRNLHTTGYWFLDDAGEWTPPADLLRFLESGPPPVSIGFGSMTTGDPQALTQLVLDAVARSGQRAILLSGWAGLRHNDLPPTVFQLDAAPHSWLFPRMAAVVHHGGAGTTAEGLRAGIPNLLVPHLGDQLFWGRRVEALGVGPRAIPRPKLTAAALANAITQAVCDQTIRQRAAALGATIRAEDGIATAVGVIEGYLRRKT
jgi:UDP:flavonoid glycosyltransferase YjiC (YdhE family)